MFGKQVTGEGGKCPVACNADMLLLGCLASRATTPDGLVVTSRLCATCSHTCRVKAKFHYTDPTRTRPDPHGLFCGETPLGPCGSGRVRVVEFSYNHAVNLVPAGDQRAVGRRVTAVDLITVS